METKQRPMKTKQTPMETKEDHWIPAQTTGDQADTPGDQGRSLETRQEQWRPSRPMETKEDQQTPMKSKRDYQTDLLRPGETIRAQWRSPETKGMHNDKIVVNTKRMHFIIILSHCKLAR